MDFLKTFADVIHRLESNQIDYMIVGSIASIVYGEPRLTNDMDVVISLAPSRTLEIPVVFPSTHFYVPPMTILAQEVVNAGQFYVIDLASSLKVDFIFTKHSAHSISEFSRRQRVEFLPEMFVWMAAPEDVIIKKLVFHREGGSEKHIRDIRGILAATTVDQTYLTRWVTELNLANEWAKCTGV